MPSGWFASVLWADSSCVQLGGLFYQPPRIIKSGDTTKVPHRFVYKSEEDELASTSPDIR